MLGSVHTADNSTDLPAPPVLEDDVDCTVDGNLSTGNILEDLDRQMTDLQQVRITLWIRIFFRIPIKFI